MTEIKDDTLLILKDCIVLGGSGFPFTPGQSSNISFCDGFVICRSRDSIAKFSFLEVIDVSVTGPGTVTTGGGFIGGGFGVEGALEGIAIAGVLNMLTTKKKIHTFVTLTTNFGELHLHYGAMDPAPLRIYLSAVFVQLRRLDPKWIREREQLISSHLENGLITPEEAGIFKSRLTSSPTWLDPKVEVEAQRLLDEMSSKEDPKGLCPNCEKVISLHSETCKYCRANFGQYASWSVTPIT
jgi:hypothetical protein